MSDVTPDIDGLRQFLLIHYGFESEKAKDQPELIDYGEEWEENDDDEQEADQQEQRQQLISSIDNATDALSTDPAQVQEIFQTLFQHCDSDLHRLAQIAKLLETEFVKDHKREQVRNKVKELVSQGQKVLLISVFSDTVIDYYRYLSSDPIIMNAGIGMAIGSEKQYYCDEHRPIKYRPNNLHQRGRDIKGLNRLQLFRLFAPDATCRTEDEYPTQNEQISVLIGSETLSVGQNLQDANYLISIDLPYNPMVLEQRIGRIDRPKKHPVEYITIYYANSQSQLLRQATRLNHLHQKLIGDLAQPVEATDESVPLIANLTPLGASIYGDTLFDDEVLPGYANFIGSLVNARRFEQDDFQERAYPKQETSRDLITHYEILHCEEVAKLIESKGEDYQPNPIAVGKTDDSEPTLLANVTVNYFGPNGELICDRQTTLYWNNLTGEQDAYGLAIATGVKTPELTETIPASTLIGLSNTLYEQLIILMQHYQKELEQPETPENIAVTSERMGKLQKRLGNITQAPLGLDRKMIRATLSKLSQHTEMKAVQKLLKDFTEGDGSHLEDTDFLLKLVNDTAVLSLLDYETIRATSLSVKLNSLLLRVQ